MEASVGQMMGWSLGLSLLIYQLEIPASSWKGHLKDDVPHIACG